MWTSQNDSDTGKKRKRAILPQNCNSTAVWHVWTDHIQAFWLLCFCRWFAWKNKCKKPSFIICHILFRGYLNNQSWLTFHKTMLQSERGTISLGHLDQCNLPVFLLHPSPRARLSFTLPVTPISAQKETPIEMHKIITLFKPLKMSSLLMPEFSFDWKSPSCNANAINALFTDTHTGGRKTLFFFSFHHLPPVWWRHKMREYVIRGIPHAHLSFFKPWFFLGISSIWSTEEKKWEEAEGARLPRAQSHAGCYACSSWYHKHTYTYI